MWKAIASVLVYVALFVVVLVLLQALELLGGSLLTVLEPVVDHVLSWAQTNLIKICVAALTAFLITARLFYLRRHSTDGAASDATVSQPIK